MQKKIKESLEKAADFLIKNQNEEGSWFSSTIDYKGPTYLQKPISVTPQVIESLIYLEPKDQVQINKGILYCFREKVDIADPTELLALQLTALNYSNTPAIQKKAKQILKAILEKQTPEGYWASFPKTSNLALFFIVPSIKDHNCKETLEKIKNWMQKTISKDKLGWGANEDAEEAQVSFTANAILTLLDCGENIHNPQIQKAIEFLKSKQLKDNGWPSSNLTYNTDSTTYATSLVCLGLMKTGNVDDRALELGIKFLIESQYENGAWPLKRGDTKVEYFTTCIVAKALKYYLYIKEKLKEESIIHLLSQTENKANFINYLFKEFEKNTKENFLKIDFQNMLDKILATTPSAVERRRKMLKILEEEGEKDNAAMIDALKKFEEYKDLNKRSHIAQIQNDMDALANLGFIEEYNRKYFLVKKI